MTSNTQFDYIIIGAGSAGCVLANRLLNQADCRILLLEAGKPDNKTEIRIPAAFSALFKSDYDWAYHTQSEPGMAGREMFWPRGKMLGGSSSLNAMIYIRGNALDYDDWAKMGNEGWSYEEVLPYFRKAQHQERGGSTYHGVDGPLNVADQRDINPISHVFIEAAQANGFEINRDFNGSQQDGVGHYQVTQKRGSRHSTASAYLKPKLKDPRLTTITEATVTGLLFEDSNDNRHCTGVSYRHDGQIKKAAASKEIILCGGAINSPQLLMLSGIGPAEHLTEHGIDVVMDLPGVGQNLQDHLTAGIMYRCKQNITLDSAQSIGNIFKYLTRRKGMLTSIIAEGGAFWRSKPELDRPDIQYHFAPAYFIEHGFHKPEGAGISLGITLLYPESRGEIGLRSADPLAAPHIKANYCSDPEDIDMQTLLSGLRKARKIINSTPFDPYRGEEYLPGWDKQSDDEIIEHIRATSETLYHPVGTCKMGGDPMAVVNDELKVHGVRGLRVVDGSVMPKIVGGNTNAPIIMIAEKAADMILAS